MHHKKWQVFPVLPLHQCLQRAVMNEPKQLSISNPHIRVPRRRAFNFIQVPFRCVLVMPSNSVINAEVKKKRVRKSIGFQKKICSPLGFEPATSWMQVSCSTLWAIWLWFSMECCSSFLHFFVFNPLQNTILSPHNSRWQTWSRRMMGIWC